MIHLGDEAFGILKPKFEWKIDVLVGHIEMIEPPEKPLQETTTEVDLLSKESSVDNIPEVKVEPPETVTQKTHNLPDVTSQPQDVELPDTTTNLIVALPPDMQLNLDYVPQPWTSVPQTTPCSVKLYRCDIVPTEPKPSALLR